MKKLSRKAEDLLQEILDHRDKKGNCDTHYWQTRFEGLTVAEDTLIRSLFKELREANAISVQWADDYPYILMVLANGLTYFEEKQNTADERGGGTYTNNFFGTANGVQIQQNVTNSTQSQTIGQTFDEEKINELIQTIKKYDAILENDYGQEDADELRKSVKELETATSEPNSSSRIKKILTYIRDLSLKAGSGLISSGIGQLVASLLK